MARSNPEAISPTAHYTGYVWFAHGQSHEAFATRTGRVMYEVLRAPNAIAQRARLPTLPGMLLARHRLIDLRLEQAIRAGEVSQIVEVACGLSPRGWRFAKRYGDQITYVEADLPGMLANKRRVLAQLGGETAHHYTREIDALATTGPASIDALCAALDPGRGTAIITEGLINYYDRDAVVEMWRRFADALGRFPRGIYFSDLLMRDAGAIARAFGLLLSGFVRGKVHLHFSSTRAVEDALAAAGFTGVVLDPNDFAHELTGLDTRGASAVKIVEAIAP